LHANEPVARDRLIEEVWGGSAPTTVNAVLNVYLSRIRRLLADGNGDQPLVTEAAGYVLRVPPERVDARRFEALLEQGRRELAHGDAAAADATLRSALALWRGPALADLAYEAFAQREISRLEELRLSAVEERIEAELTLGQSGALVPELEALVSEHPYRERLCAQLMLALYRCGRQAEALESYRRARRVLTGELGIEPGPRLQELERAVLRHDASLDVAAELPQHAPDAEEADGADRRARLGLRWAVAVSTALVLVLVAAVVVVGWGPTNGSSSVKLVGNSVAVIAEQGPSGSATTTRRRSYASIRALERSFAGSDFPPRRQISSSPREASGSSAILRPRCYASTRASTTWSRRSRSGDATPSIHPGLGWPPAEARCGSAPAG
jgi:DNA-binding SARP family transcriptional activator